MASLVRIHASDISRLFGDVCSTNCQDDDDHEPHHMRPTPLIRPYIMDERWTAEVGALFVNFHSKLAGLLRCDVLPECETQLFIHTMQHVAHLLRNTPVLYLRFAAAHRIYDVLLLLVHGNCINVHLKLQKATVCALFASVGTTSVTGHLAGWKKAIRASLRHMSTNYLDTSDRLRLLPRHPRAATDTLVFKELHDLVVNKGDKRLAILFISMLPEMMGANDMSALLQSLSMHMHRFASQVIDRTLESASRKLIRLFFAAAGRCTCHTKCSVYGKVDEIQLLPICKTCRTSPVFLQEREPRCRRTISSTSFINVCDVDGNTSFIYIPLYRACVNKSNGQLIYEHWAYTLSLNLVGSESDKALIYMLCAQGRRTCTNVFLSDSLTKTRCDQCRQGPPRVDTCLTARVGKKLAALCDGCIIAACCPLHAPLHRTKRELWLSILESLAK
jgi:hypothetical protein